jgi:hypothetical protein
LDLDLDISGAGKEWKDIQPTLAGKGGAVVLRGSLLNVNIANELLFGLEQLPLIDKNALDAVRSNNPKLFSGNNTAFKDLRADVRIENGKIHSKGLVLKAADYVIYGDGWVSLDRQMGMKSSIVFSSEATKNLVNQVKVLKYLTDDKGQLVLPLTLSGSVLKPTVAPDIDVLSKKLQDAALDAGLDELKGGVQDQVKDFLKGFGKKSSAKKDSTGGR